MDFVDEVYMLDNLGKHICAVIVLIGIAYISKYENIRADIL